MRTYRRLLWAGFGVMLGVVLASMLGGCSTVKGFATDLGGIADATKHAWAESEGE